MPINLLLERALLIGIRIQARPVKLAADRQTRLGDVLLQSGRHDHPRTDTATSHGSTDKAVRTVEPLYTSDSRFKSERLP